MFSVLFNPIRACLKPCIAGLGLLASTGWAQEPQSLILFIVDGMNPPYTVAYRHFADDPTTEARETTVFDQMLVGMARTYPNDNTLVTDSAAAATALATGVKTYNGAIGLDVNRNRVESLVEAAKKRGYNTAVVATATVNHATPASFLAHVQGRESYAQIADQIFEDRVNGKPKVDLLFGGGRKDFVRKDRDLAAEFRKLGYGYFTELNQLDQINQLPALGLFADEALPHVIDAGQLHLEAMTRRALALLENDLATNNKPFFMMVEASQVDWCGHANDIACALHEMKDAAASLQLLKDFVDRHPNSLLVATADHGTGGLSIGANNRYEWGLDVIRGVKASASRITHELMAAGDNWAGVWQALTGIQLEPSEVQGMEQLLDKAASLTAEDASNAQLDVVRKSVTNLVLTLINQRSHTGWTSRGHTGDDVQVFAWGKGREDFIGNINNTDIPKIMLGRLPAATESGEKNK